MQEKLEELLAFVKRHKAVIDKSGIEYLTNELQTLIDDGKPKETEKTDD